METARHTDDEMPAEIYVPEDTLHHDYKNSFQTETNVKYVRADIVLDALNLINTDKDGDGFVCREGMEQIRALVSKVEGQS